MTPRTLIGSDHAGFELKELVKNYLHQSRIEILDVGCNEPVACDYPNFAQDMCRRIQRGEASRGILICGTGLGMSIAANRFNGIRAALCTTELHARLSRSHNDANVLVIGSRITGTDLALAIVKVWLNGAFEGGRHARRVELIDSF